MKNTCTCGVKFRTAEDWRDHMPCPGNELDQIKSENKRLKMENEFLSEQIMGLIKSSQEKNEILVMEQILACQICLKFDCPGAPRFKGICARHI